MKDQFGRDIHYMRISITDRCNLRCKYCMPNGIEALPREEILTGEEIEELARLGAELGIDTLRITGGEPLVRKDVVALTARLKKIPGIKKVVMTSNGVALAELSTELKEAGLDGINVSLDAADRQLVRETTGRDCYEDVLKGIDAALAAGIPVKLNSVLADGEKTKQWQGLLLLAAEKKIPIRFIEMMPVGYGKQFTTVDNLSLKAGIQKKYPESYELEPEEARNYGAGPASYLWIPELSISVGFISAIHGKFCHCCNRVRLSSQGFLKACLCYGMGADLKTPLRQGKRSEVLELMKQVIYEKPGEHCFEHLEQMTENREMVKIGG